MFLVLLVVLLSIWAIQHTTNIYRPLGDRLIGIQSRENITIDGAAAFGVFFSGYGFTLISGCLHTPFAVAFIPYIELGAVAEWVNVYFLHFHSFPISLYICINPFSSLIGV